jgi:hypothetical protein
MRTPAVVLFSILSLVPLCGCRSSQPTDPSQAPTQADRLTAAYPDLAGGRFAVLADFEDPKQMELVQLVSVSHQASTAADAKRGQRQSGLGCLRFVSASPDDAVLLNNAYAKNWFLKRDWRDYDLLLASAHAPRPGLFLQVTLGGGAASQRRSVQTSRPLETGWNVLRLDLFEVGQRVSLDDVQEIRLSVGGAGDGPVELLLDDIILTQSRENLLGDPQSREGGFYVQRVGRRWKVGSRGAGNDFELTFANGQIVEWFNTAVDPYRLRNFVRGTQLGPTPLILGATGRMKLEPSSVRSRLMEVNPVRVVVVSEWTLATTSHPAPAIRWAYTVYPTGQVYVVVDDRVTLADPSRESRALAVSLDERLAGELQTDIHGLPSGTLAAAESPYASMHNRDLGLFLSYALYNPAQPILPNISEEGAAPLTGSPGPALVATQARSDSTGHRWVCQLLLDSRGDGAGQDASARALAFLKPRSPRMELGRLGHDGPDGPAIHGFSPSEGCFVVQPENGQVRLLIGESGPLFSPAFRVASRDGRDAWVYVDHFLHRTAGRTYDGDLVFQMPGPILKPTLVEVFFREQSTNQALDTPAQRP